MHENLFVNMLEAARRDKEMVCIFRDPGDLSRFAVGYVVAVSDDDYTLEQIDPEGRPDGLDVGALDDIIEVRRESRYVRQIALLMENSGEMRHEPVQWNGNPNPESCLSAILSQAKQTGEMVNLLLATGEDEARFFGLIQNLTETHVCLDVVTDDGEPDGTAVLRLDDIAGLQIGTHEERKLALFHKHRLMYL